MDAELDKTLFQVRAAHRLLWAYYRRQADMLAEIDEHLGRLGYSFHEWKPWRYKRLGRPSTPFWRPGKWAWDIMPGMAVDARWSRKGSKGRLLGVHLFTDADSGFEHPGGEPDPHRGFRSIDQAKSELQVFLWNVPGNVNWTATYDWANDQEYWGRLEREIGDQPHVCDCFVLDLAELPDRAQLKVKVLDPIKSWTKDNR